MKVKGTIQRSDLEGGLVQLRADDGTVYEVEAAGADPAAHVGARVEVDGTVDRGALSFTMTGPRLRVRAIKRI